MSWYRDVQRCKQCRINHFAVAMFTPSRKNSWSAIFTPMIYLIFYATAVVRVSGRLAVIAPKTTP